MPKKWSGVAVQKIPAAIAKLYVSQGAAREVARSSEIDGIENPVSDRSRL